MTVLLWGILIFVFGFALHFLIWKVRLPQRQVKTFLQIFFGVWIISIFSLIGIENSFPDNPLLPHTLWEYIHISFLTLVIVLSYMNTYPGIEADSPTLVIVHAIKNAGSEGLEKSSLEKKLNNDVLVSPRIQDLLTDHMAYLDGSILRLTSKGKLMARIFIFYRSLMKAPKGG